MPENKNAPKFLPESVWKDIDSACDAFELAFKRDTAVRIETFLNIAIPNNIKGALLRELLSLEIELRHRTGETLSDDEFHLRFPDAETLVDELLVALSNHSLNRNSDGAPTKTPPLVISTLNESRAELPATIGEYEVLERIGQGGMGVVFKARHQSLNRIVAIKTIRSGGLASEDEVQRFLNEAEASARLDHPGIVPIFEIGQDHGQYFFSMAFIEGESLADRIRSGPCDNQTSAKLVEKIAQAVHYAHQKDIVHRDLKPANILLDGDHQPKVTDFGLARMLDNDSGMTATGQILGTPSYMAPEQAAAKGAQIGPKTDVYSLGAILYCLLVGRPPFQASTPMETVRQVLLQEPVSPRSLNPAINIDLETICLKCLSKEVDGRYESAEALAQELTRYRRGEPILARPISSVRRAVRWCRRNPTMASLLALILTVVISVAIAGPVIATYQLSLRKHAEDLLAEKTALVAEKQRLVDDKDVLLGEKQTFIQELTSSTTQLEAAVDAEKKAADDAKAKQRYAELNQYASQIALAQQEYERNEYYTAKQLLYSTKEEFRDWEWKRLRWLMGSQFELVDTTAGKVHAIDFSPDGTQLAALCSSGTVVLFDTQSREIDSKMNGFIAPGQRNGEMRRWDIEFTPNGKALIGLNGDGELCQFDLESGQVSVLFDNPGVSIVAFDLSGDGEYIAISTVPLNELKSDPETQRRFVAHVLGESKPLSVGSGVTTHWEIKFSCESFGKEHSSSFVSLNDNGQRLLLGGNLFDVKQETLLWEYTSHSLTSGEITADSRFVVYGTYNGVGVVVDGETGELTSVLNAVDSTFSATTEAALSDDGMTAVIGNGVHTIPAGGRKTQLRGQPSNTKKALSPDGSSLVTSSHGPQLVFWKTGRQNLIDSFNGGIPGEWDTVQPSLSHDGRLILACDDDRTSVRDFQTDTFLQSTQHAAAVTTAVFAADELTYLVGKVDGSIDRVACPSVSGYLCDLRREATNDDTECLDRLVKAQQVLPASTQVAREPIRQLVMDDSGSNILAVCGNRHLILLDAKNLAPVADFVLPSDFVTAVWFSFDEVIVATADGIIRVIGMRQRSHQVPVPGFQNVSRIAISPDKSLLAVITFQDVLLYETATMKLRHFLKGHTSKVVDVMFTSSSRRLLTAGYQGRVRVWDVESGLPMMLVGSHSFTIRKVAASGDHNTMLTIDGGRNARVWHANLAAQDVADPTDVLWRKVDEANKKNDVWAALLLVENASTADLSQAQRMAYGDLLARARDWQRAYDIFASIEDPTASVITRQIALASYLNELEWLEQLRGRCLVLTSQTKSDFDIERLLRVYAVREVRQVFVQTLHKSGKTSTATLVRVLQ